ncbi:hypothetical protein CBM2609_B30068 [Cupriavidus taiwanensis]|nr:hypothetical protein CBM2609_B30068 [Cupriavidus taiwanensis]
MHLRRGTDAAARERACVLVLAVIESRGGGEMPQERLELPAADADLGPLRSRAQQHLACRVVGPVHAHGACALVGQVIVDQHIAPRQQVRQHEVAQRFLDRYRQAEQAPRHVGGIDAAPVIGAALAIAARVDGELRRHRSDRHDMYIGERAQQGILRLVHGQQARRIGVKAAIDELVVVERVAREVGRRGTGGHRDIRDAELVVALEIDVVRRLEYLRPPGGVIDRGNDHPVRAGAEQALAEQMLGAQQFQQPARAERRAPDTGKRPAPLEDLLAMPRQQVDDAACRQLQRQGKRNDTADRSPGDQVEPRRNRRPDLVLEIGEQLGRVQPAKAAARKREDLKPVWSRLVQGFPLLPYELSSHGRKPRSRSRGNAAHPSAVRIHTRRRQHLFTETSPAMSPKAGN